MALIHEINDASDALAKNATQLQGLLTALMHDDAFNGINPDYLRSNLWLANDLVDNIIEQHDKQMKLLQGSK